MPAVIDTVSAPGRETRFSALFRATLKAEGLLFAIVALYAACYVLFVAPYAGTSVSHFLIMMALVVGSGVPFLFAGLLFLRLYHIARHVKPEHPIPALLKDMKSFVTDPVRGANGLPLILALFPFMFFFTEIKAAIPMLVPFSWDVTFDLWDRALHFGYLPWELLQPILGYAPITFLINFNYNFWFFTMWIMWVFFAFTKKPDELRTRFFFTFMVTWAIGGSLLAVVFSSAGPCYFTRLGLAPDPYAPLMAYLNNVNETFPVWALEVQDRLWNGNLGVSAMPSMHNGTALLFAIAAFNVNRTMGYVLAAHAALIFLGSIHLGWHYAIDGYLAWALTIAVWLVSAPVARWWHARATVQSCGTLLAQRANA
jgi:hypothetical protein